MNRSYYTEGEEGVFSHIMNNFLGDWNELKRSMDISEDQLATCLHMILVLGDTTRLLTLTGSPTPSDDQSSSDEERRVVEINEGKRFRKALNIEFKPQSDS